MISEDKKAYREENYDNYQKPSACRRKAESAQTVCGKKGEEHTGRKGGDIQRRIVLSKNPPVAVKNHRNCKRTRQQSTGQRGEDMGETGSQFYCHIHRVDKHRKKQKLYMLPGGFAHGEKQTGKGVVSGPFIDKM